MTVAIVARLDGTGHQVNGDLFRVIYKGPVNSSKTAGYLHSAASITALTEMLC